MCQAVEVLHWMAGRPPEFVKAVLQHGKSVALSERVGGALVAAASASRRELS